MARRLLGYRWRDEPLEVGWFLDERKKRQTTYAILCLIQLYDISGVLLGWM